MKAEALRAPRGRRTAALVGSTVFHAVLLLLGARYLGETPDVASPPIVTVYLVPAAKLKPPPTRRREPRSAPTTPTPNPRRNVAPRFLPPSPDSVATPEPAWPANGEGEARRALRGLVGCDPANLSRLSLAERERCFEKFAAQSARAPKVNLDVSGRFAENAEPYLVRKPTKGCKVRATGDVDAMGDSGNVRAGVGCAIPF